MPTIQDQLENLARLDFLLQNSSENTRPLIITEELKNLNSPHPLKDQLLTLGWLNFQLQRHVTNPKNKQEEPIKNKLFITLSEQIKNKVPAAVSQYEKISSMPKGSKAQIKEIITKHQELIFSQILAETIKEKLEQYQEDRSKGFSSQQIITEAHERYKKAIYKESLLTYETTNLAWYYAQLSSAPQVSRDGDLLRVEDKLNIKPTALDKFESHSRFDTFKLDQFKQLHQEIDELDNLTTPELKKKIKALFAAASTPQTLDAEIITQHPLFNQKTLYSHMTTVIDNAEKFTSITAPNKSFEAVPTQNNKLSALREAVSQYQGELRNITKQEEQEYKNRYWQAVKNREAAIEDIQLFINSVDKLTPQVTAVIMNSMEIVINSQPTWSERSFLLKILDVLERIFTALGAQSFFKETEKSAAINQQLANLRKAVEDSSKQDNKLVALRNAVQEYQNALKENIQFEQQDYSKKEDSSLSKRLETINNLALTINTVDELTPQISEQIVNSLKLVVESQPTRDEHIFLNNILSVLDKTSDSLGKPFLFSETKESPVKQKIVELQQAVNFLHDNEDINNTDSVSDDHKP